MENQEKVGILVTVGVIAAGGILLLWIFWPSKSEVARPEIANDTGIIQDSKSLTPRPPVDATSPSDKGPSHLAPPRSPPTESHPPITPSPPPPSTPVPPPPMKSARTVKASVAGGIWITKKNGASDILRGVSVCLLPKDVAQANVQPILEICRKTSASIEERWRESSNDGQFTDTERAVFRSTADLYGTLSKLPESGGGLSTSSLFKILHLIRYDGYVIGERLESRFDEIENLLYQYNRELIDLAWAQIVGMCQVGKATSDIEGKYRVTVQVPAGEYFLAAQHATMYGRVKWLLPINIKDEGEQQVNLFNENAEIIFNEKFPSRR